MREIICKAKIKDNGEWIQGYYRKMQTYEKGDVHFIHPYEIDLWMVRDAYEIDPNTICCLTHMKDINKDEIWENDIVECLSNNLVLQVVWSDECQEFLFEVLEGGYDFMIGKVYELSAVCRDKKIKVISNIFDEEV